MSVLTLMDAQFGFTGHPFFNYKIKNLFASFKDFELSQTNALNSPSVESSEVNHNA